MSREGLISQIFGQGDGLPGWYIPEEYYWSMRETRDMNSYRCSLTPY